MKRVLFLCTGNSARSQMAEAFLKSLAGHRFEVLSAGLQPRDIHPLTVRVMDEVGVSLSGHRPKPLSEFLGKVVIHYPIVVCEQAEQECPKVWPFGGRLVSWSFDDPAAVAGTEEERLEAFRDVRDKIEASIKEWLAIIEQE